MPFFEPIAEFGPPPMPGVWVPAGPWPVGSPDSQGMDAVKLSLVDGIDHGVVIRRGVEVWSYGDAERTLDWASCNRPWLNVLWGKFCYMNGEHWNNTPARDLPCDCASEMPGDVLLKQIRSYTSQPPVGQVWRYSCGWHWPWQSKALGQMVGTDVAACWNSWVKPFIGGTTFQAGQADDGTLRVKASCRDNARLMGLYLSGGLGFNEQRIMESSDVAVSMAGGVDGTGYPFYVEGWQTHLIRGQQCNAGSSQNSPQWIPLHGVPDGCLALDGNDDQDHGWGAIVALPSLELVVAARGSTPAWWLPDIVGACR